jgi:hypothetical protein
VSSATLYGEIGQHAGASDYYWLAELAGGRADGRTGGLGGRAHWASLRFARRSPRCRRLGSPCIRSGRRGCPTSGLSRHAHSRATLGDRRQTGAPWRAAPSPRSIVSRGAPAAHGRCNEKAINSYASLTRAENLNRSKYRISSGSQGSPKIHPKKSAVLLNLRTPGDLCS